jgi:superfamily II DNA or RNA helicase
MAEETAPMVPHIRLFTEPVVVDTDGGFQEFEAPVIQLSFDYPGARLRVSDPRERIFYAQGHGMATMARDAEGEAETRKVLESFGAVDLNCLDHYGIAPDSAADYVVRVEGDSQSHCAFSAHALPKLRARGWRVDVDEDYPYQVIEQDVPWYASVAPEEDKPDWFSLELGVEIDGRRTNLLPALVDLLDNSSGQLSFESLAKTQKRCFVPVSETQYVPVPPERLRSMLHVVMELYQHSTAPEEGVLELSTMQAGVLESLDETFREEGESLQWEGGDEVRRWGKRLSSMPQQSVPAPEGLQATLRPYQQQGLDWLQHLRACGVGGVLADDMGLGKTLQTIAHIATEKDAGRLDRPVLVIAPTSLVGNWHREIGKFAPHLDVVLLHGPNRHEHWSRVPQADVVVTTYPLLVRDEEQFAQHGFYLQILDEAQTIKNRRSLAHRAAKKIDAEHRLCLTGTPLENHLGELWSLFDFLNPGLLGDESSFRQWFQHPIERQGDDERLAALQQLVSPYILRRLKDQVAKDLPPKTELMTPVELAGKQRELYESIRIAAHTEVRSVIRKKGFTASTIPILDALMKLRQVCCDPRMLKMDAARFVKSSAKYDALMELLDQQLAQGRRILIFSQFTTMLQLISQGLKERRVGHVALTGATQNRQKVVDSFEQGRVDVFLISLKAGGTGLNLTSADTVIHCDPWWNPAAQSQATDRAYRIGQTKPVFVYNLFAAGSVEERMLQLQRRKKQLADAILGGGGRGDTLTEEDVDILFAPLND